MTEPRISRPPITGPPAYGRGSNAKRIQTLRGPDGGRGRGTAQLTTAFSADRLWARAFREDGSPRRERAGPAETRDGTSGILDSVGSGATDKVISQTLNNMDVDGTDARDRGTVLQYRSAGSPRPQNNSTTTPRAFEG